MTWDHPHLTEEQFAARILEVELEEASQPEAWMWMSFAGDEGLRGVIVMKARGMLHATRRATRMSINPGGEVMAIKVSFPMSEAREALLFLNRDKLMTREEAVALDVALAST